MHTAYKDIDVVIQVLKSVVALTGILGSFFVSRDEKTTKITIHLLPFFTLLYALTLGSCLVQKDDSFSTCTLRQSEQLLALIGFVPVTGD